MVTQQERERPEVRRSPEEDDEEEPCGGERESARGCCVADKWRHGTGGAAEHDVLGSVK